MVDEQQGVGLSGVWRWITSQIWGFLIGVVLTTLVAIIAQHSGG